MIDERGWKQMSFNIAIDGPGRCRKKHDSKKTGKKISFVYVDTGAMYRAMGYYFLQHGIRAEEEKKSGKPVKIFLLHWLMKAACRKCC